MKTLFLTFILGCLSLPATAQDEIRPKDFLKGEFIYCEEFDGRIVFKGNTQIETFIEPEGNEVYLKGKIKWTSENEYRMTCKKVQGSSYFKKGMYMDVKVLRISGDQIIISYVHNSGYSDETCFEKFVHRNLPD